MTTEVPTKKRVEKGMSQGTFFIALIALSMLCVPFIFYAVKINIMIHKDENKGDHEYARFTDSWIMLVSAIFWGLEIHFNKWVFGGFFAKCCKETKEGSQRDFYLEKANRSSYQTVYFIIATAWGYYTLKDTNWLPWQLGGDLPIHEVVPKTLASMPYEKVPRQVLVYALSTMGFHVFNCFEHCFLKERASDFFEMLLHHIACCSLYFCMIYGNNMGIGCTIAFLHDIADIFGNLVKCLSTTKYDKLVLPAFLAVMVTWFWTRIYVLPVIVWFIF
jgi:hypothetical protein